MKKRYLDVMEKALSAYSLEEIDNYFRSMRETRPTDQGFARLTANIGRLLAYGRRTDLYERFLPMMDFCCESMWRDLAANDFSVQELVECVDALVKSGRIAPERTELWRQELSKPVIYNQTVSSAEQTAYNWVLFSAVSEFMRMKQGLCPMDMEYIDMQLTTQMRNVTEEGMYRDPGCPMVYDLVPRMLFSLLLFYGYDGQYRAVIDESLRRAGLLTLRMQSVTGEIPYGGRSNQFHHNEAWLCVVLEFEAARYRRAGDGVLAARFKRAADDALRRIEQGLSLHPIRHIKNRFPTETKYGCEDYAYFGKYMITVASVCNWAMHICEEDIPLAETPLNDTDVFALTEDFHKVFLRAGDMFAECELYADSRYDASGLGRIHKRGVPPELCLSCPGTAGGELHYDADKQHDFCFAAGTVAGEQPLFMTRGEYRLLGMSKSDTEVGVRLACELGGAEVLFSCSVDRACVRLTAEGAGTVAIMLPALYFNGEEYAAHTLEAQMLTVSYRGHTCQYETDGSLWDMDKTGCNRNGHYKLFYAKGEGKLAVTVTFDQ